MVKPGQFMRHLGNHLEQLALFTLPKSVSYHPEEPERDGSLGSDSEIHGSMASDESVEGPRDIESEICSKTRNELIQALELEKDFVQLPHKTAPALALGWQPPHDFTPPASDFNTNDAEWAPTREESTIGGDLFTPGWVRGHGKRKEGCYGRCAIGHWVNLPSGAYEFHLTYLHGLPSTGFSLPRPSVIREDSSTPGVWEGFCDDCHGWRALRKTNRGWNWFRHYLRDCDSKQAHRLLLLTKSLGAWGDREGPPERCSG